MIDFNPKNIIFYTFCLTIMILPTWDIFVDGTDSQIFQNWLGPATAAAYCIMVKIIIALLRRKGKKVLKYEKRLMMYGSLLILVINALRFPFFDTMHFENWIFVVIMLIYMYQSHMIKTK